LLELTEVCLHLSVLGITFPAYLLGSDSAAFDMYDFSMQLPALIAPLGAIML
jgi:hypothetical protein